MTRAYLGLGSNLGDRVATLRQALVGLGDELRAVSDVYQTDPVGGPTQGRFLNLVAELETPRAPLDLLAGCQELEADAGRVRLERWGPRTLDVDVLWIDGVELHTRELEVPHPRMWQRRFVLAPLRELAPDLVSAEVLAQAEGQVERLGRLDALSAS